MSQDGGECYDRRCRHASDSQLVEFAMFWSRRWVMDVVKRNIQDGVTLEIAQQNAPAPTYSLLPLTLAILDGMSVRGRKLLYPVVECRWSRRNREESSSAGGAA
ncbi:hypothetical protein KCP73_01015 [Salmonella enterica subsp. enterica]|nr:hypothetical protein KCP73_01015 [Salmonella enterica subsp. enterica]